MIRAAVTTAVLAAALAAGGSTAQTPTETRDQARLAKTLEGLTAGEPRTCIDRLNVSYIRTFEDTIVYVQGRNKKWRNDTVGGCNGLKNDDIVVTRSPSGGQYCAGDMIETHSRSGGFITGACSLGKFVPYTR